MQGWFRRGTKRKKVKMKKINRILDLKLNIALSVTMLVYLSVFFIYSLVDHSDKLGFILSILSAIVTFCFEGYEWLCLKQKNKGNRHSLMPWVYSALLILVLIIISVVMNVKIKNTEWNNAISSGVLLFYIILMTARKIIEDY